MLQLNISGMFFFWTQCSYIMHMVVSVLYWSWFKCACTDRFWSQALLVDFMSQ